MKHGIEHLSSSSLGTYQKCPLQWRLHYLDRIPEEPALPAALGSFGHQILEWLIGSHEPADRTIDTALSLCKELWYKEVESDEPEFLILPEWNTIENRQQIARGIRNYFRLEDPTKVDYHEVEQAKHYQLTPDYTFKYILDRLDNNVDRTYGNVDYKFGKMPLPAYATQALMQLYTYAWLELQAGYDVKSVKIIYMGDPCGIIYVDDVRPHLPEIEKTITRRTNKIFDLLAEDDPIFKPKTGPLCAWCSYVGDCPKGQQEVSRRFSQGNIRPDAPAIKTLYEQASLIS